MNRRKSIVSHAASIPAWCAVFDGFNMVAASSVERHGPDRSSAARRKTQRLAPGGRRPAGVRSRAAAIARWMWAASPFATSARTCSRACGMTASKRRTGLDMLAADHERDPKALGRHLVESPLQLPALGRSRGRVRSASSRRHRRGRAEDPGVLIGAIVESREDGREAAASRTRRAAHRLMTRLWGWGAKGGQGSGSQATGRHSDAARRSSAFCRATTGPGAAEPERSARSIDTPSTGGASARSRPGTASWSPTPSRPGNAGSPLPWGAPSGERIPLRSR